MTTDNKCRYYDYGRTAPREYGAFCYDKQVPIETVDCSTCKLDTDPNIIYNDSKIKDLFIFDLNWTAERAEEITNFIKRYIKDGVFDEE